MSTAEIPEGTVTVLFTDLVDSTKLNQALGDEGSREVGRALERLARDAIDANRGIHIKEIGDGVMAAFASARRAIACAREIQRGVAEWSRQHASSPVEMRIGLHTGEVIEEDGDLHGETVIIAKRIEGTARPGTIYASDTVHGVLGTVRDELVDAGEHELKGIASTWRLYEVPWRVEPAEGLTDRTPYVGREAEQAEARALLHRTAEGRGALLLISGDAGVGKSRLVGETLTGAASVGAVVLTGQCLDMHPPPPFQPVVDQIAAASRALTHEQFRVVLGDNAAEVAALMPALRQRYDDLPEPPPLPPDQERQYVLHGVVEFIERGTVNQPLILVFEDLHWADESTLVLLQSLAPRLARLPLLVVATHRPIDTEPDSPLAAALPTLTRHDTAVDLRLGPLDSAEVAALLETRAGSAPPPGLVELVIAETDGNPYFVEELYRHLVDSGKAFDESGAWRTDVEIGETEVPKGVQLLVGQRLDGLGAEHRRHLAIAAVIGRTFAFDLLDEVARGDEEDLFDALEAAERLHLVEDATVGREATYRFTHELVRQSLLADLSVARRQRVHLRVAEALAGRAGTDRAAEISNHYDLAGGAAGDTAAGDAHLAAAEAVFEAVAFEDALVHLDRAADRLADDAEGLARTLSMRARCLQGLARIDDALGALRAALDVVEPGTDVAFDLRSQLVTLLLDLFRGDEALTEVERLAGHPRTTHATDELDVLLLRARTHYILALDDRDHADPARQAYERAHALAVELGDDRRAVRALLPTVWFTDYWSDYRPIARDNVAEAARLAAGIDDVDLAIDVEIAKFQVRYDADVDAEARRLLERLEERRDPLRLKEHCFTLMWFHFNRGHFADDVAVCDRGIELAEQLGVPPVMYGSIKALSLTEMGRYDEIEAALAQEVTTDDFPFGQAMADLARTSFLARIGAWEPTIELGVRTYEALGAVGRVRMQSVPRQSVMLAAAHLGVDDPITGAADGDPLGEHTARELAAELALVRDDPEQALELAAARADHLGGRGRDRERAHALLVAADAARILGEGSALEHGERALEIAETNEQGSLVWQARAVLGHALLADGDRTAGEQALPRARSEFAELAARISDSDLRRWFEDQPRARLLD